MACRTCSTRSRTKLRQLSQKHEKNISELSKQLHQVQSDLEAAQDLYNTELASLNDKKEKIKNTVAHFKADVIKILDDFDKETLGCLEQNIVQFKADIAHQFNDSRDQLIVHKEILDEINTNRKVDETKLIDAQKSVTQIQDFLDKIKYGQIQCVFIPDAKLLEIESEIQSIGDITVSLRRDPTKPYFLKSVEEIFPSSNKDTTTCSITGLCSLTNGDVVMADSCNKKLTRLSNDSLTPKGCLRFLGNPWDVCTTRLNEIAVTFPEETRNVRFISTSKGLQRTRSLKLRHICRGIDYFEEELFVTDQGIFIYVYTIDGTLLRKFSRETSHRMLSDYRTLSVSKHLIVLTDWDDGIMAFDRQGKLVWRYKDNATKRASGVCFSGDDTILICCSQSINLVQLNKYGKKVGEVAGTHEGLVYPTSVCFDSERSAIIVGQQEAKTVKLKVA